MEAETQIDAIELAAGLVGAYVSNNSLPAADLAGLLAQVHGTIASLSNPAPAETGEQFDKATPAQIRKSITPDALISFIDGKPYKTLKRHLSTHGLDFDGYRTRYGLPADYPTVAASYSEARSALAKSLGLGSQRKKAPEPAPAPAAKAKRATRTRKVAEPA